MLVHISRPSKCQATLAVTATFGDHRKIEPARLGTPVISELEHTRRRFLRMATAFASVAALSACGPGDDNEAPTANVREGAGSVPAPAPALAPAPAPAPTSDPAPTPTVGLEPFTWQVAPDQTLALAAGTTTTIATNAFGLTATVSPSLPTGRTLSVNSKGHVVIIAAPTAPAVNAQGPWLIQVTG
jgi:hypothetical protein